MKEEIKKKFKKYLETKESENTSYQKLWDSAKAIRRGNFISINAYVKKERSQANNLPLQLKDLDK